MHFWNFLIIVFWNSWPICLSHEKSDPKVRIVSVQRHNYDLYSVLTVQPTSSNFQYGSYFGVPSDPSFWCRCSFISWQIRHDKQLYLWIMRTLQYPSSWNTVRIQHSRILNAWQNLLYLPCCDNLSIRSPSLSANWRSFWARSPLSNGTSVLITLGTNEELDCKLPHSTFKKKSHILNSFLRLLRKDRRFTEWIMQRNLNRFLVGYIVFRQFSMSFSFQATSGQWTCDSQNCCRGCRWCRGDLKFWRIEKQLEPKTKSFLAACRG